MDIDGAGVRSAGTRGRRWATRPLPVVLATIGMVPALVPTATADGPPRTATAQVAWHAQAVALDDEIEAGPVEGASASLVATESGASVTFRTHGLRPGHAYTLWYVVVDNPGACSSRPCTARDIIHNPEVRGQIRYGAGNVVGESGRATFSARSHVGPLDGWLPDRTFTNPLGAEYHFVVNDHGPRLAEHMPGMIRTYRGGCRDSSPFPTVFPASALADGQPGPNRCLLTQVAVFQP